MEAGGYELHLYCDACREKLPSHDYDTEFPHAFFAESRSEVVRLARRLGWVFHRDGIRHTCPKCSGRGDVRRVDDGR